MSVASQSPRLASGGQLSDGDLDLPALGAALWGKKWKILRPTILVALIALGVVQLITPRYLSEARVIIEARDANIFLRPDADKDLDRNAVDPEAVTSQVQLILSRDLARDVIEKLKLGERPEFDPALGGISPVKAVLGTLGLIKNPMSMTPEERVLEAYYERLNVYPVEKSRVIMIDFLSEDPELAAKVSNAIADAYLVLQRTAKQDQARTAVELSFRPDRVPAQEGCRLTRTRWRRSAPSPTCWSATTTPRCRRSNSATSIRRLPPRVRKNRMPRPRPG